jgi:hypothetical protein
MPLFDVMVFNRINHTAGTGAGQQMGAAIAGAGC